VASVITLSEPVSRSWRDSANFSPAFLLFLLATVASVTTFELSVDFSFLSPLESVTILLASVVELDLLSAYESYLESANFLASALACLTFSVASVIIFFPSYVSFLLS